MSAVCLHPGESGWRLLEYTKTAFRKGVKFTVFFFWQRQWNTFTCHASLVYGYFIPKKNRSKEDKYYVECLDTRKTRKQEPKISRKKSVFIKAVNGLCNSMDTRQICLWLLWIKNMRHIWDKPEHIRKIGKILYLQPWLEGNHTTSTTDITVCNRSPWDLLLPQASTSLASSPDMSRTLRC